MDSSAGQEPHWIEVTVITEKRCAEAVADLIMEQGSTGIAEEADLKDSTRVILKGYLVNNAGVNGAVEAIKNRLPEVAEMAECALPQMEVGGLQEEDWNKKWKSFFQPISITERLVIKPPWRDYHARTGEVVVELDPGMAFGTGTHPSTRMCLRVIDEHVPEMEPGARLLDVGTGSGILAIAAAKLGLRDIVATDIDYTAMRCAQKNSEHNGVSDRITFTTDPLRRVVGSFELVVANILPHILIDLRGALFEHTAEAGRIVLAGILNEKAASVQKAFSQKMNFVRKLEEEEWCCLIFER
jgi:ribosomal protein L11 methyltransferase